MATATYSERRGELETYFDRTAVEAWARMTSDSPLGRIRATVRAGREAMRATLLAWLPADLLGRRLLDAGCGTGALAVEAARRGAEVVGIDLSPKLISLANERAPRGLAGSLRFEVGDLLDPRLGRFDHVIAMDSLIHYPTQEMSRMVAALAARADVSVAFTYAPRTPLLATMHAVGKLFPKSDRAPAIEPASPRALRRRLAAEPALMGWEHARTHRISAGFYISEAAELVSS